MADITEMHSEITRRIRIELSNNENEIQRWRNPAIGEMAFRRQVEIAHKSVGLATALSIIDAVFAELEHPPAPPV